MEASTSWEELGSTAALKDSLSRQLADLRMHGFCLPWTCEVCSFSNIRTLGTCETCCSGNEQYEAAFAASMCALHAKSDLDANDHVLLLLARAKGSKTVEASFQFCEAIAKEAASPDKAVWHYRRAFKQWHDLDSDLCSDGVPAALRDEADEILKTRVDLSMHCLPSDIDPILGAQHCTYNFPGRQQRVMEQQAFAVQQPPSQPAGSTQEPIAIIIPMRGRERQLKQLVPHLRSYLSKQGISNFRILVVEQAAGSPFNKGLSLNIGVAYLLRSFPEFKYICFHDVDLVPTEDVDYSYAGLPTFLIGRRLLWEPECHEDIPDDVVRSFQFLSDKTLGPPKELQSLRRAPARDRTKYGVLLCPMKTFLKANGWSNNFWGWGEEDVEFEQRLQFVSKVEHRNGIFSSLDLGFHLLTSFGHRWCKLHGKCTGDHPAWLDVAQVLNGDHARNEEIRRNQQQRRQEAAEADSHDGFCSIDLNSLFLTDVVSDGTYLHVRFDVSPDLMEAGGASKSSKIDWPAPCPLEGVKSQNRVIFEADCGQYAVKHETSNYLKLALTLSSRVLIASHNGKAVTSLVNRDVATCHKDLRILHLGPAQLSATRGQMGYSKAVDFAMQERCPHVLVLHEASDSGDLAWRETFVELLNGEQLCKFLGALVVVCSDPNLSSARKLCNERWVLDCGELRNTDL